jgi:endonuclease/exonuclease/phosphatase family metal-dependent hydrolase
MRVVSWNLFHGRAVPDRPRSLLPEFTDMLAGWAWDVALLQEVPPWWPALLAPRCDAVERHVLTSRNALLPVRRWIADRRPDVIKSNGGGANAILVRGAGVTAHAALRLRMRPERRMAHAVALADGTWVGNIHATTHPDARTREDIARAADALARWSQGAPVLLGGDMNITAPRAPGLTDLGGHGIDRFLARGLVARARPVTLDTHGLSDHAAVAVEVVRSEG